MSDEVDLEAILTNAAQLPQSTVIDGTTSTQHSLKDLTDLADRQAGKSAASKNHRGIRFSKLVPPGTR